MARIEAIDIKAELSKLITKRKDRQMATTRNKPTSLSHDEQLHAILSAMADSFHDFGYNASKSAELVGINVHDSLALEMKDRLVNPLKYAIEAYSSSEKNVLAHLDAFVVKYLTLLSDLIAGVWKTDKDGNTLEYVIALKEYNLENRSVFNEFLDVYEHTGLDSKIPIVFHYIPQNLISGLKSVTEIKIEA